MIGKTVKVIKVLPPYSHDLLHMVGVVEMKSFSSKLLRTLYYVAFDDIYGIRYPFVREEIEIV